MIDVVFMSGIVLNEESHLSQFLTVAEVVPGEPRRVSQSCLGLIQTSGSSAQSSCVQRGDLILFIDNRRYTSPPHNEPLPPWDCS